MSESSYSIKGQAGKGMDATARSFKELRICQDTLRFATLADEFFSYTLKADNSKGDGVIVPTMLQTVKLLPSYPL